MHCFVYWPSYTRPFLYNQRINPGSCPDPLQVSHASACFSTTAASAWSVATALIAERLMHQHRQISTGSASHQLRISTRSDPEQLRENTQSAMRPSQTSPGPTINQKWIVTGSFPDQPWISPGSGPDQARMSPGSVPDDPLISHKSVVSRIGPDGYFDPNPLVF